MSKRLITGTLIAIIVVSAGSKNLWPYCYALLYFQGSAVAWLLASGLIVYLTYGMRWAYRIALILFCWSLNDVVEMWAMDRTAFDINEYITAAITAILILVHGRRKKRNGRIRHTGY